MFSPFFFFPVSHVLRIKGRSRAQFYTAPFLLCSQGMPVLFQINSKKKKKTVSEYDCRQGKTLIMRVHCAMEIMTVDVPRPHCITKPERLCREKYGKRAWCPANSLEGTCCVSATTDENSSASARSHPTPYRCYDSQRGTLANPCKLTPMQVLSFCPLRLRRCLLALIHLPQSNISSSLLVALLSPH